MLERNSRYSYTCFGHSAEPDAYGRYYCRARNAIMRDDHWLCQNCPLLGGTVMAADGNEYAECWYYDLEDVFSPGEGAEDLIYSGDEEQNPYLLHIKNKIDGMIMSGFTTDFPAYLSDEESMRAFGKIEEALIFAGKKHKGQTRKGSREPYICHPVEVMMITARMTDDNEVIEAAALHDTLEDTDTKPEELEERFGKRVLSLVKSESENKREGKDKSQTWKIRKQETIDHLKTADRDSKIILMADKLSNLRATSRELKLDADRLWDRFNVKDPALHAWYYTELLNNLSEFKGTAQYEEYKFLLKKIFG